MKVWKLFVGLGLLVGLGSCGRPEVQIPSTVLSSKAMIPIMVDVHVGEGARNGALILGDTNGIEDYYAKIYEKHQITEQQFKESFAFYSSHPDIFIPIYEAVLDSLKINGELLGRRGVEADYD